MTQLYYNKNSPFTYKGGGANKVQWGGDKLKWVIRGMIYMIFDSPISIGNIPYAHTFLIIRNVPDDEMNLIYVFPGNM